MSDPKDESESTEQHGEDGQSGRSREAAGAALSELIAVAEDDARRSARADAAQRIRAESKSLLSWARERGWLLSREAFEELTKHWRVFEGGREHQVLFEPNEGRVFKKTLPPNFGARGDLVVYLKNLHWCNVLFEDDIRLHGILETESGMAVVISQPFIKGRAPTNEEIKLWFEEQGFEEIKPGIWNNSGTGVRITDAHSGNFVVVEGGELVPIDLQILNPGRI